MIEKDVAPSLGRKSFTCPHCGAITQQNWYCLSISTFVSPSPETMTPAQKEELSALLSALTIQHFGKRPNIHWRSAAHPTKADLSNAYVAHCHSCNECSLWTNGEMVYPAVSLPIQPNVDLPDDIKTDFLEAANIAAKSPRGAAALLRLCIQKLCMHLGESGKNINNDIAALVGKGLEVQIQQALDVVRVVGNDAVHPGTLDLRDDIKTVAQLFELVNWVADRMITQPTKLKRLYASLPNDKLEAIARRDAPPNQE